LAPARAGQGTHDKQNALQQPAGTQPVLAIDPLPPGPWRGTVLLTGRAPPGQRLWLVLDGHIARAQPVQAGVDGRWEAAFSTAGLVDPTLRHRLLAWDGARASSPALEFQAEAEWQLLADVPDPMGDDHGPAALPTAAAAHPGGFSYRAPLDAGYARGTLDLRRLQVWGSGGALRLEVEMGAISRVWSPANGFDHLALTLYIALPGQPGQSGGSEVLPLQDAAAPLRWHRRLRLHGWSNALTSSEGAGPAHEGQPVAPGARLQVDAAQRRIRITLPAAALGVADVSGLQLYLTTWDYDGGYRALAAEPGPFAFGHGSAGPGSPKVMDDLPVLTLP
jgi:hypothetical protein